MRKLSKSNHTTLSELNITPLLDLAFVLLVIFVLTTAPPSTEDPLELAKAKMRTKQPVPKIHYVTIEKNGQITLNRSNLNDSLQLTAELVKLRKVDTNLNVNIRGDAHAPYSAIRNALKAVQNANVIKVRLATEVLPNR